MTVCILCVIEIPISNSCEAAPPGTSSGIGTLSPSALTYLSGFATIMYAFGGAPIFPNILVDMKERTHFKYSALAAHLSELTSWKQGYLLSSVTSTFQPFSSVCDLLPNCCRWLRVPRWRLRETKYAQQSRGWFRQIGSLSHNHSASLHSRSNRHQSTQPVARGNDKHSKEYLLQRIVFNNSRQNHLATAESVSFISNLQTSHGEEWFLGQSRWLPCCSSP